MTKKEVTEKIAARKGRVHGLGTKQRTGISRRIQGKGIDKALMVAVCRY